MSNVEGEIMKTIDRARKALRAGGYITICGNAARFRAPDGKPVPIRHATAVTLVKEDGLEHYANGCHWPYPSLFRIQQN